jgi:hypothetical protein
MRVPSAYLGGREALRGKMDRPGLRFTVFYSSGLAGCAKLSAGAGVSTRLESK